VVAGERRVGEPLLEATGLRKEFPLGRQRGGRRTIVAVDDIDLAIHDGEAVGLVGESGSGKSTTARLVTRLIEPTAGRIRFAGRDITALRGSALRAVRRDVQMVFQDISGALSPRLRVDDIVAEPLVYHFDLPAEERRRRAVDALAQVGLDEDVAARYPRQLSGGQRQRVGLARALVLRPRLLVLDEPVSALDAATQARAVNLLAQLQRELGLAYLFIAHDLLLVHHLCDRIAVMYLGAIMEVGPAERMLAAPWHPYTEALISAIPARVGGAAVRRRPVVLHDEVPTAAVPSGCRFRTRCRYAFDRCAVEEPRLTPRGGGSWAACHLDGLPEPADDS
jgi:oligopeptide/dipeptide ABC transporter ATP-binding protein